MTGWFGRIGIVELTPALYTRGWIRDILAAGEIHHLGLSDSLKCLPPRTYVVRPGCLGMCVCVYVYVCMYVVTLDIAKLYMYVVRYLLHNYLSASLSRTYLVTVHTVR